MIKWTIAGLCALLLLAACDAQSADTLDAAARDYVELSLTIGEKEEGYIDAYYGPPEIQAKAEAAAAALTPAQLIERTDELMARVTELSEGAAGLDARRARFLIAQLTAAKTRLRMMSGEKLSFEEEALGLFGVRPQLRPLASFDPILAQVDTLVPGDGPLSERVDAFENRFTIPANRLKPVFDTAIAECRARTLKHIALPATERFTMGFVTDKSWSGYNYYQGNAQSRIDINTDLPIRIGRAVDLGCHEGYPGHHVLNVLLEQRLVGDRGWIEYSVYPLYSPQSLIAEGSANYGIELAFPATDKLKFETSTLYPLAGLSTADAESYSALEKARRELTPARFTIARDLLEGRIDEAEAVRLTQRYELMSEERAKQRVAFAKQYRSYVINYGLGLDMVRADVEGAGPAAAARWKRMEQLLSEPTLPADLQAGGRP